MKTMLFSMTGFVSKTIKLPQTSGNESAYLTFNVKSLNARFFEATCRLPYTLAPLEIEFTTHARTQLKRGYLSINISMSDANYFKGKIQVSLSTIEHYLEALTATQKKFNLPGEISIATLLQLPNLFSAEEGIISDELKQYILSAFDDAIGELKNVRASEGALLLNDLNERLEQLTKFIKAIEATFEETFKKRQEAINQQLQTIQTTTTGELAQQQRTQLYLELDHIDIHEEITRFNTHLQAFINTLASQQEEKGRHLDFILQELGREINTMSAKCANSDISTHSVAIKVELEKCREQIQNIV